MANIEDLTPVVARYGTHYYTSADMGGSLLVTTSTSHTATATMTNTERQVAAQASFSAKVSGYGANVDAASQFGLNTDVNQDTQDSFESNSTHSYVISYGGAPGSFGPPGGAGSAPTNWADWAGTVDLLPVPVQYKVDRIVNILSAKIPYPVNGLNVTQKWLEAEANFYFTFVKAYQSGM